MVGLEPFYKKQLQLPPKKPQTIDNDVNTVGVYNTCYLAMHYMRQNVERGGQIIITSSGLCTFSNYIVYQKLIRSLINSRWNLPILCYPPLYRFQACRSGLHALSRARPPPRRHPRQRHASRCRSHPLHE